MDIKLPTYQELNFKRPVTGVAHFQNIEPLRDDTGEFRCNIDRSVVQEKINLWNRIIVSGVLEVPNDNNVDKLRAINLLHDKTIKAYHMFKYDNSPLKLRWYQDLILSDNYDRILFVGSNQIGKSITLVIDAAMEFTVDHGKEWVGIVVSNSIDQAQYQMDRIKLLLKTSNLTYQEEDVKDTKSGKRDTAKIITYTYYSDDGKPMYTSRLICCPHTSSALGYPADNMWIDEIDFWENVDVVQWIGQVAKSRTIETKGKIKCFSNPNGKEKAMFKLTQQKFNDGTPIWHIYNFNYWDRPGANFHDFTKLASGETQQVVDSMLLAKFSRTKGTFFSTEEIQDQFDNELDQKGDMAGLGRETAWFLDVGTVHDQSALIGGYVEPNPDSSEFPLIKSFWIHKYPVGYPIHRVLGVDKHIKEGGVIEGKEMLIDKYNNDGWDDYSEDNPSVYETLSKFSEHEIDPITGEERQYFPLFGYDATSDTGILPLLHSLGIDAVDIKFSGKFKWHMYQRYQYYTQMRYFKRANDRDDNTIQGKDFAYQASKLIQKASQSKNYHQIHHESEDDFDDTQDAVVGMIHLIENPDLPSLGFSIIDKDGIVVSDKDFKDNDNDNNNKMYVPSFMKKEDLIQRHKNNSGKNWMQKRMEEEGEL